MSTETRPPVARLPPSPPAEPLPRVPPLPTPSRPPGLPSARAGGDTPRPLQMPAPTTPSPRSAYLPEPGRIAAAKPVALPTGPANERRPPPTLPPVATARAEGRLQLPPTATPQEKQKMAVPAPQTPGRPEGR